jgi:outer membrane protein
MKTSTLRRGAIALAAAASLAAPMLAQAQNAPWLVRVRAVNLDSANKDGTGLGLTINNKVIPEVDISYFFSPNLAAELILTYPQKHTVYSNGVDIGSLKHLPPTLTVQYHFPMGAFKPYVGAGLNVTNFSSVNVLGGAANVKRTSYGLAVQAGADYEISKNVYLNLDIKKVQIGTTVSAGGADVGKFKVDPLLVGLGVGMRF